MSHTSDFLAYVNQAKKQIKELTCEEVQKDLSQGNEFYLVDTREDQEWDQGHIKSAIHIGKGVIERDISSKIPDKKAKIVLYCGGGFRSALAAKSLQEMGYTDVYSMDGGIREWKEKKYPME